MGKSILPALVMAVLLGGCASQSRALRTDEKANEAKCAEIATTGDMYRDCLEIGPERTLAAMHDGDSSTAISAVRD
jgi:hypothetical protein